MKLKHILPFFAAVLLAFPCGCDTASSEVPSESEELLVTENTAVPEDTDPPETEAETETEIHIHVFTETVTPPACESEGYTTLSCACGYTYDTNQGLVVNVKFVLLRELIKGGLLDYSWAWLRYQNLTYFQLTKNLFIVNNICFFILH